MRNASLACVGGTHVRPISQCNNAERGTHDNAERGTHATIV
jgi:hypothetical protein